MRGRRINALAVLLAVMSVLAACADETPEGGGSPSPSVTVFTEPEWTITTLATWTREDVTATADAKKAIRYAGPGGNYVIVAIDPTGSDFSADAVWRYEVTGSGFEIVEKTPCTGGPDQQCSTDDGRWDGYALWKSGGNPPTVGGHTWYVVFGNTQKTTVDETLFERIIENIRVKGA